MSPKKTTIKKPAKIKVKKRITKKKRVLSGKMKKILDDNKKMSKIIMFEDKIESNLQDIPVSILDKKPINISVVKHPLDQYFSPHLLDLSSKRYIERVVPSSSGDFGQLKYSDLPAGEILEKLHFFEFLSFENSEILCWIKKMFSRLSISVKKPFRRIDFSAKLPLSSKKQRKISQFDVWQEVAIVNFFIFIGIKVSSFFETTLQLGRYSYHNSIGQYFGEDEVVNFEQRKIPSEQKIPIDGYFKDAIKPKISLPKLKISFPTFNLFKVFEIKQQSLKPLLLFFAFALIIVVPIRSYFYLQSAMDAKGKVLGQAENALSSLEMAQDSLINFNLSDASSHLMEANQDFISAQKQLNEIKSFLTVLAGTLPVSNTYRSGKNMLELGEKLTKAGESLVSGLEQLTEDSNFSLSSRAKNFQVDIKEALVQLESANENLDKINISHIPEENKDQFIKLQENLPVFMESLKKSDEMVEFAINFLGDNDLKRYLIVFQNDNELRATGGFMGSFALVDFKNGDIEDISVPGGGTYDVRAGFTELLASPEPMRLINPRWEFQDSNWWPDWPTSAKNIAYFYNKSDGATLDGVIAVNSDWLGSLLDVVGSIEMPDYQKVINSANFEIELQKSIEIENDDKKSPKKILGDLAPQLIEKIFNISPNKVMDLVASLNQGLVEKDILIHLFSENEEEFVMKNNWDGRIKNSEKDYLSVVATNIGGGKTDGIVNQEIYHKAKILEDGSVIDSLIINRNHFGPIDNNFTNVANRSYIRVYVPLGSELISANGFKRPNDNEFNKLDDYLKEDPRLFNEQMALTDDDSQTKIYIENGKTVFGNWLTISPGQSEEILLVYKLPFKIDLDKKEIPKDGFFSGIRAAFSPEYSYDSYSLLIQKQPGSNNDKFVSEVGYPDGVGSQILYPDSVVNINNKSVYEDKLSKDLFYFVGLKP